MRGLTRNGHFSTPAGPGPISGWTALRTRVVDPSAIAVEAAAPVQDAHAHARGIVTITAFEVAITTARSGDGH